MPNVTASTKSIPEKLQMKPGKTVLFINKPVAYDKLLGRLPDGVIVADSLTKVVDIVQIFVQSKVQVEQELPRVKKLLAPKGMIWLTYPKLTSIKRADINRDTISSYAETLGMEGVAMVSIDDDWSALRLKVVS